MKSPFLTEKNENKGALHVAKIPAQIREIIDEYVRVLENNHIHIRGAVLFGSYAEGRADEWSDIDIALVSESFDGDRPSPLRNAFLRGKQ